MSRTVQLFRILWRTVGIVGIFRVSVDRPNEEAAFNRHSKLCVLIALHSVVCRFADIFLSEGI